MNSNAVETPCGPAVADSINTLSAEAEAFTLAVLARHEAELTCIVRPAARAVLDRAEAAGRTRPRLREMEATLLRACTAPFASPTHHASVATLRAAGRMEAATQALGVVKRLATIVSDAAATGACKGCSRFASGSSRSGDPGVSA